MRTPIVIMLVFMTCLMYGQGTTYTLSNKSEEYNTRYFYVYEPHNHPLTSKVLYMDGELPSSFVLELSALQAGEKVALVYNDNQELIINKKRCVLRDSRKFLKNNLIN